MTDPSSVNVILLQHFIAFLRNLEVCHYLFFLEELDAKSHNIKFLVPIFLWLSV